MLSATKKQPGGITGKGFQPGRSGNPGGKPKDIAHVRELARQHTPEAIETLVQVMHKGKSDSAKVAAATAILDRGWGKPEQAIDITARAVGTVEEAPDRDLDAWRENRQREAAQN